MRTSLLGATTVAAAIALAAPAAAADDMMGGVAISGGMTQDIGFGNWIGGVEANDSMHFQTDSEIQFTATGETDGGLKVTARMEMKTHGKSAANDENWLAIEGTFGKIVIGGDDDAATSNGYGGIGGGYAGMGYYDSGEAYGPAGAAGPIGYNDAQGVRYSTPSIGGFQAGISFQPDGGADGASGAAATGAMNDANVIGAGATFSSDFAGTSLTLAGAYLSTASGGPMSETVDGFGVGASLGIGDSTLSLRYDSHDDSTTSFGVGVDHSMGALSFGIGFGSKVTEDAHTGATGVMSDETHSRLSAGGTYDMGGGVKISAAITQGSAENTHEDGTDNDDVGVGLRIAFSF